MSGRDVEKYRDRLRALADRMGATVDHLVEQTREATGGQSAGNLSNAPMHLADAGTELYQQELSSTLLENESYLRDEVIDALNRLDRGAFGKCERCGQPIPAGRLEALPYARHCTPCATKTQEGTAVNLNAGRPQQGTVDPLRDRPEAGGSSRNLAAFVDLEEGANADDPHAAGTAGGGTAVGGLAGTNIADGDPANADLEGALASGRFDAEAEEEEEGEAYSGPAGGSVGGTPANKRVRGGRTGGGIGH